MLSRDNQYFAEHTIQSPAPKLGTLEKAISQIRLPSGDPVSIIPLQDIPIKYLRMSRNRIRSRIS